MEIDVMKNRHTVRHGETVTDESRVTQREEGERVREKANKI